MQTKEAEGVQNPEIIADVIHEQSSSLEFRLVFFVVRSCVKEAISKPLVDQFIRKFEQF